MNHFKGKQFQQDVIIVAVGYYLRYNLSYREVQEILYDRGINVSHTTIYRWVQEYGKVLYHLWKKKNKKSFYSWKMDETYIKIKGKWHYLYRAIDADGLTLDIWLRKKRDTERLPLAEGEHLGRRDGVDESGVSRTVVEARL
ncbi:IS6 family transposase, partial [Nocardia sp. NPDC051756]|uniref:IS6 family transposase n=1 Tax=Nocardia sp. NPDC051756 TaxID=3154751 RepID=UPI00343B41D7